MRLGIYEAPLAEVANLVLILLAILTLVTVAAVAGGTYLLAQRLAGPIRVLRNSLDELAHGRYDYRIATRAPTKSASCLPISTAPRKRWKNVTSMPMQHRLRSGAIACGKRRSGSRSSLRLPDARRRRAPVAEPPVARRKCGPVIAQDDDYSIVIAAAGDSAESLAQRYLGDAARAGGSPRPTAQIRPGQVVVIPLRSRNPIGVYARRLSDDPDPLLSPLRRQGEQADRHAGGVRRADAIPRAERLPRAPAVAPRGIPRRPGAAAEEERGHHDRRRLPLDVRNRLSDPEAARLPRDGLPLQRLRRRRRRAQLGADEGDGSVRAGRHSAALEDPRQPDAAACRTRRKAATASACGARSTRRSP